MPGIAEITIISYFSLNRFYFSQTMAKETESKLKTEEILSNKENEVTDLSNKITELKLSREEIEESLLDTQVWFGWLD